MPRMIVDVHTHVFPPRMVRDRERLARDDAGFAALYGDPSAKMATAEELLHSMERAEVDVSVAAGFWWRAGDLAAEHAAYLIDQARAAGGRIVPFVPVDLAAGDAPQQLQRLATAGARGLGEVRPANQSLAPDATDALLGQAGATLGLASLVHASEEVGHGYAGKAGGYTPGALWRLVEAQPARVIAAHWGGGFPFHALIPEVRALLDEGRLVFDTAASTLLYERDVFRRGLELLGPRLVLWGSDFPLRDQAEDRAAVEAALPDEAQRRAVLGENAARFLALGDDGLGGDDSGGEGSAGPSSA